MYKCLKRYTITPDTMYKNIEVVNELKKYGHNAVSYLNFAPDVQEFIKKDSFISPDGNFIISNTHWGRSAIIKPFLLLLGPIHENILMDIINNYEKINVLFYNGVEIIEASWWENLTTTDEFKSEFANPNMCGNCPAQASCLLSKLNGNIVFSDDDENGQVDLSKYTWAKEQQAFLDATKIKDNIIVNAAAGTGKTTVLNEALQQADGILSKYAAKDVVLITFTNTAANEMLSRVTAYAKITGHDVTEVSISTWHSLALDILKENYLAFGYQEMPELIIDEAQFKVDYLRNRGEIVNKQNLEGLNYNSQSDLQSTSRIIFNNYAKQQNVIFLNDVFNILKKAIYLKIFNPKVLIVDEFQDSSYEELQLIELLTRPNRVEQFIALGDMRQGIYGFRGGVRKSFTQAAEAIELNNKQVTQLAFSESFRLPLDVATASNEMLNRTNLPDVKSALDKKGLLANLYSRSHVSMAVQELDGTFGLIARTNATLIYQYITFFKNRKDVYFKFGNSVGEYPLFKVLNNLIHMIINKNPYTMQYMKENNIEFDLNIDSFKEFLAKYDILSRYIGLYMADVNTFEDVLHQLLIVSLEPVKVVNNDIRVYLLTAHGSKGMEFDNVVILDPEIYDIKELNSDNLSKSLDLLKNSRGVKNDCNPFLLSDGDLTSSEYEARKVAFVALSRAKNNLLFCRYNS